MPRVAIAGETARIQGQRQGAGEGEQHSASFLPNFVPYRTLEMEQLSTPEPLPFFVPVGRNAARVFGLDAETRASRLAAKAKLDCARSARPGGAVLLSDLAFAWDPAWLAAIAKRPGSVLMLGDRAVLAHVPAHQDPAPVTTAMEQGAAWTGGELDRLDAETAELNYHELRKRDRPFVLPLDAADTEPVERAAYDASYKGVTDALTLYLWRRPAFHLTRWAARLGMTPNQVTLIGAALCLVTIWLFARGDYWLGMATGFGFMVLDTVDGKLARCTGQSSWWGNIFDHGIDLVHPPFWWWAWAEGLNYHGDPFERVYEVLIVLAIVGGYVVQRVIEGVFMRKFGMHIHVWQPLDSRFRLVTARRNPNMIILLVSLVFRRPDMGLELVALWTMISVIFHAVRLAQANARTERGAILASWLA
jgi:phosphatidylglycerophosphate synthase